MLARVNVLSRVDIEELPKSSILGFAEDLFVSCCDGVTQEQRDQAKSRVFASVEEHSMSHYYKHACEQWGEPQDPQLLAKLEASNRDELKQIEAKIADATENLGDVEIRDGRLAKAHFLARIGDKEGALQVYDETLEQDKTSLPQKLDVQFCKMRLALAMCDNELLKAAITK